MVLVAALAALAALPAGAAAAGGPGTITTVAGGGSGGDGLAATDAELRKPRRVAPLPDGGFLVVEFGGGATYGDGRVRRVWPDGTITTVAGTGVEGFGGDGGPAIEARMSGPTDVVLTGDGGFLVADEFNHRVRRVGADGVIWTVAGSGAEGCGRQSGRALDARLTWPRGLAVEPGGRGYLVLDENCGQVHRVTAGADARIGTGDDLIATVAGRGGDGFSGDGGPATAAQLHAPRGVAALPGGAFLIADSLNHRVRRVGADGVISTVAGTGANAIAPDGGPATQTPLATPRDVEAAPGGGFLIAESGANRVRLVGPDGRITTIAGAGGPVAATSGDGGPAVDAELAEPHGVNVSPDGDVYVSGAGLLDLGARHYRVRLVQGPLPSAPGSPPSSQPPQPPPLPGAPPVVEAPPAPAPATAPGPVAPAVAPAGAAAPAEAPLGLRLTLRGPRRAAAGGRVVLLIRSARPIAGRRVVVEVGRRVAVRGRVAWSFRRVRVVRPAGRAATVAVRVTGPGARRARILWSEGGRLRRAAVTIAAGAPAGRGER